MGYTITRELTRDFAAVVADARAALADNGFGVLTEIDMKATLKAKLDVDIPAQVILGACRPPLAYAALQAEPSIAVFLPCNVVVRDLGEGRTLVEAMDPAFMVEVTGKAELDEVAADARTRIGTALDSLEG
ncbi:MAG: DUF302 domain-containing protein [Actinomycetales bacterium]|nr:DUF302 domain-containing protein [Candidatus Phosphoribacter baldrii]